MMQYTNGFSCAVSKDSGELILKFLQQSPVVNENGSTQETKIEEITELIMPNTVAKQLSIALNEITSEEQDSIEIEL